MKKIVVILILIFTLLNTFLLIKCVNKLSDYQRNDNQENDKLIEIPYVKTHLLTNCNNEKIFNLPKECLVYFYRDDCSACDISNEYVEAFIEYGFITKIDIYFVNLSQNPNLLGEKDDYPMTQKDFKVAYTPTVLYFTETDVRKYEGSEEVFAILDYIVTKR